MGWIVTATHAVEGTVTLSEPEGLADAIIGLTRQIPDFHSLIKEFKTSFKLYGKNFSENGQREWFKNIESVYGPDAVITILLRYSDDDNYTYESVFSGEVGIQSFNEYLDLEQGHTIEFTPVQTGMWRKAISRFETPVDIQSAVDLDGNAVDVLTPEVLNLPSQIISYFGEYDFGLTFSFEYTRAQINFDIIIRDDIKKITIPNARYYTETDGGFTTNTAGSFFKAPADGVYIFEIQIFHASHGSDVNLLNWFNGDGEWRLMKAGSNFNVDSPNNVELIKTNHSGPGSQAVAQSYILHEFNLLEGEEVQLLGFFDGFSNVTVFSNRRLVYKTDCDLATIGTIALSGEQIIDGVLTSSSRVLVWNQDDKADNGVYVSAAGAWSRASDVDSASELINAAFKVISGDNFSGLFFRQTNDNLTTLGTDIVTFEEFPENHEYLSPYPGWAPEPINFLRVESKTTFEDTESQGFLLHDVGAAIFDRITDHGKFYSPLFGSEYTKARTYPSSGAWWNNALAKGVHIRGYTLSEKLFSKSAKQWYDNVNMMFNTGMSYETIDGEEMIVVRKKSEYYDASSMSVLLSNVQRIRRKYSTDYFNSVETGFNKGKVEDISGIDDPQKQTRASIFKNIGGGIKLFTDWIAQSITWETTRRTTRTKSADYKFDDDTFILEVTRDAGGEYSPRLDEDFDAVTGLLNEETRYNKHHTPARFFLRWLDYLSGGLQSYLGTVFRFTGGEGNYNMTSEMVDGSALDDYEGAVLAENANIPVGTEYLYIPEIFEIDHYLTQAEFNIIDANRNLAIGISQTDSDHKAFFITDLQREIKSGQIKVIGYFKERFTIVNVDQGGTITQGGRTWDATFDFSFGD